MSSSSKKSNYRVGRNIGKGSFGIVTQVTNIKTGEECVWKELDYGRMKDKEKQQLVTEVNVLRELNHPNIVRYKDRIIEKDE